MTFVTIRIKKKLKINLYIKLRKVKEKCFDIKPLNLKIK